MNKAYLQIDGVPFGEWLESNMKKRGMTQTEMGKLTGMEQGSISRFVNGYTTMPTVEMLLRFARAFDIKTIDIAKVKVTR